MKQPIVLKEDNQNPGTQEITAIVHLAENDSNLTIDWFRFSQFNRLRRTVAWLLKFSRKQTKVNDLLTEAEIVIWRIVQWESYTKEMKELEAGRSVSSNSKVVSLAPFLDANGIMRARGRLRKSELSFDTKHPIILPSSRALFEFPAQAVSS